VGDILERVDSAAHHWQVIGDGDELSAAGNLVGCGLDDIAEDLRSHLSYLLADFTDLLTDVLKHLCRAGRWEVEELVLARPKSDHHVDERGHSQQGDAGDAADSEQRAPVAPQVAVVVEDWTRLNVAGSPDAF
jgi:hypothetical protein